jgi:acetyl-CoA acetyltransferase
MSRSVKGKAAVVGIGGTPFYRRGEGEAERKMILRAIVAACADAGINPSEVDGFASYGEDPGEAGALATSLGSREFRLGLHCMGGGGGLVPAIGAAVGAVNGGMAETVAVYRGLAQAQSGRHEFTRYHFASHYSVHGMVSAVQSGALRTQRMFEHHGVPHEAMEAFVLACYHHAQNNPEAMAYGKPLNLEAYRTGRVISTPFTVWDCSRESDGAFAIIVTAAERARDLRDDPSYILGIGTGGWGEPNENGNPYVTSNFVHASRRMWEMSDLGPADVDVAQVYENTAGPAVLGLIDHGFCTLEDAAEFFRFENLIVGGGGLPVNTAGGNIAAGFVHGMGLANEAIRQLRGESPNQVEGAKVSLLIGGPQAPVTGTVLFGTEDALG